MKSFILHISIFCSTTCVRLLHQISVGRCSIKLIWSYFILGQFYHPLLHSRALQTNTGWMQQIELKKTLFFVWTLCLVSVICWNTSERAGVKFLLVVSILEAALRGAVKTARPKRVREGKSRRLFLVSSRVWGFLLCNAWKFRYLWWMNELNYQDLSFWTFFFMFFSFFPLFLSHLFLMFCDIV